MGKDTSIGNGSIVWEHFSEDVKRRFGAALRVLEVLTGTGGALTAKETTVHVVASTPIAANGLLTVDGTVLSAGKRVLRTGEVDKTLNGIFTAQTGDWVRVSEPIYGGMTVKVKSGVLFKATIWICSTPTADYVPGDEVLYVPYAVPGGDTTGQVQFRGSTGLLTSALGFIYDVAGKLFSVPVKLSVAFTATGTSTAAIVQNNSSVTYQGDGLTTQSNAHSDAFGIVTDRIYSANGSYTNGATYNTSTALALVNGSNNDVPLPSRAGAYITGVSGLFQITGFVAPSIVRSLSFDREVLVWYPSTNIATIRHNSGSSSPGNRILTPSGRDITSNGAFAMLLRYSQASTAWVVVSFVSKGATIADVAALVSAAVNTSTIDNVYGAEESAVLQSCRTQINNLRTDVTTLRNTILALQDLLKQKGLY